MGRLDSLPQLAPETLRSVREGKTAITRQDALGKPSRIFMVRRLESGPAEAAFLVGEVLLPYLWGIGPMNTLPPMTQFCVLDQSNRALISSLSVSETSAIEKVLDQIRSSGKRQFEIASGENSYLAAYWPLFLEAHYAASEWLTIIAQSKADVLSPMADFAKMFPLVVLMAFWIVLLMSIMSIRKRFRPLEKLKAATQRIAHKEFASRVKIDSGDEFEDLGEAFNTMAGRLEKQFSALKTMSEIGQAVLSHLDRKQIIATVYSRMREVLPCETVHVVGFGKTRDRAGERRLSGLSEQRGIQSITADLSEAEMETLGRNPSWAWFDRREGFPACLVPLAAGTVEVFLVLPILLEERLSAIIALGFRSREDVEEEDLVQVRQLADQAAVALANTQLIEVLAALNWGTLQALARTVDAKSPWTAGHSEGVTTLALEIGRAMGLTRRELETLHRGGLLHDIGKIGVPAAILDKPGLLTAEERRVVNRHPATGARIVEPLEAFREAIPLIRQHHERFDGQGYPDGLKGKRYLRRRPHSGRGRRVRIADRRPALPRRMAPGKSP